MKQKLSSLFRKLMTPDYWAHLLFWSWNVIFLAFMFLGFAPQILPEMVTAVRADEFPLAFLLYAITLASIPGLAVLLGFSMLRHSPAKLFALGYGVEGPLMLMLAIRFFAVREMIPAIALLMAVGALGMGTFLWQLLDERVEKRGLLPSHLRLVGLTLVFMVGLYSSVWLAFYVLPFASYGWVLVVEIVTSIPDIVHSIWRLFVESDWNELFFGLTWLPFFFFGLLLLAYTSTIFVAMPIIVPLLYFRAWWRGLSSFTSQYGWARSLVITATVMAAAIGLFIETNQQPQDIAFELLEESPSNPAHAQAFLEREEEIRAGLLNAYLAPFRYFSAVGEVRHVSEMYRSQLGLSEQQAEGIQQLYQVIARPVLYEPVERLENPDWNNSALREEPTKAAELYEAFFDEPIVKGEREAIVKSVRSTWLVSDAEAAWQAVDDREVHLTHQELNITEHGDWAEIELYEIYENHTRQQQEVVYYFSLPESAVITGVWLGNSPNRDERFVYRVSPRGAAQAIYRNEVRRRTDPALVEQIGPNQYRLRIFPVEPEQWNWDNGARRSSIEERPPLYMWLTWRVLAQACPDGGRDNCWPLPRLAEKRNVYWNSRSVRLVNGTPMEMEAGDETWLPDAVATSSPVTPTEHRVDFPSGESVIVRPISPSEYPQPANNLQLAVILDRSRSMAEHAASVKGALEQLNLTSSEGAVELYLTASDFRGEAPSQLPLDELNLDQMMYYGGQNAAQLLAQFDELYSGQRYDAVIVLTDGSGYEGDQEEINVPRLDMPIWMVHLDNDFPDGYDDDTLEAIQASGGGVTGNLAEALTRLTVVLQQDNSESTSDTLPLVAAQSDIIDGYLWQTMPNDSASPPSVPPNSGGEVTEGGIGGADDDDFAPIAARRLIISTMQRERGTLDELETLDNLHAIAIEQSIVTPYSSMIVLVNQRQEKLLDELEEGADRFEREHEEIGETQPVTVTGVPEPEEWLLIALGVAMLLWYTRKKWQVKGAMA